MMIQIRKVPFLRHLRAEPTLHVLQFRSGELVRSGRGLTFWFSPLRASVAAVPVDDRQQAFVISGRTADFQDAAVQGSVVYRIVDPERVAERIDFGIALDTGLYLQEPHETLATLVTQLAQQVTGAYLATTTLDEVLRTGLRELRARIEQNLRDAPGLHDLGVEIVSVRVAEIAPETEVERALQTPARESIQQEADEATFARRAMAVEKERAIAENELQNRIELAKREETLISQQGMNERKRAEEEVAAERVAVLAAAEHARIEAGADAERIREVEGAKNVAERVRLEAYGGLPPTVVFGLAAQELARNIETIGHLNVAPESLGPMIQNLVAAKTGVAGAVAEGEEA